MILKLSLDLPEDRYCVGVTRHLSRCLMERLQVREKEIADVESVIGELATNAVEHARGRRFRVDMEFYADRAVITVVDRGRGFSPECVPPTGTARLDETGEERIGGWGIPLVELLSDRVQFERNEAQGTTVRAEKRLSFETDDAADIAAALCGEEDEEPEAVIV